MTKKEKIASLKRQYKATDEQIKFNELYNQQLITHLNKVAKELEDLEAQPKPKQQSKEKIELNRNIRAQILNRKGPRK